MRRPIRTAVITIAQRATDLISEVPESPIPRPAARPADPAGRPAHLLRVTAFSPQGIERSWCAHAGRRGANRPAGPGACPQPGAGPDDGRGAGCPWLRRALKMEDGSSLLRPDI